jgi:hypothetical protein
MAGSSSSTQTRPPPQQTKEPRLRLSQVYADASPEELETAAMYDAVGANPCTNLAVTTHLLTIQLSELTTVWIGSRQVGELEPEVVTAPALERQLRR